MSSNMTNQIFFFCKQQFYLAIRNVEWAQTLTQGVIGQRPSILTNCKCFYKKYMTILFLYLLRGVTPV